MNIEEKIGQMLMLGFRGQAVDDPHPFAQDLEAGRVGAVVLFDYDVQTSSYGRNIETPLQLQALTANLQRRATSPLLIAVDQEGGQVCRLKAEQGFPALASARELGRADDPVATHQAAQATALNLAAAGINLNLAPTVDLDINPDNPVIGAKQRSYSADPDRVVAHAAAFIRAHHAHSVACTLKHFPGHGSSRHDSHLDLVDVSRTWSEQELLPYRHLIDAGLADAVMTAHVFNEHLDPDFPATLSSPTIDGLLRRRLGYDGVVISDDLQMGAIARHYGLETALHRAIEAGVDMLALANNTLYEEGIAARAVTLIKGLVERGILSEERLDQSVNRISRLKEKG
jgi:beta-N-acetylhexosaminidase